MSTSPFRSRVVFPGPFNAPDAPLSAGYAQALANNALHGADECGQVRVNMSMPPQKGEFVDRAGSLTISPSTIPGSWGHIVTYGPFPCRRIKGRPYSRRVRMAAGLPTGGVTSGTVRMVWSAQSTSGYEARVVQHGANVLQMPVTSTTAAWNPGVVILTLSEAQAQAAEELVETPQVLGGDPSTVTAIMTTISLWAQTQTPALAPHVYAAYDAEYLVGEG